MMLRPAIRAKATKMGEMRGPVRRPGRWAAVAVVLILAACGEEPASAPEAAASGAPPAADPAAAAEATPESTAGRATAADQAAPAMPAVQPSAGQRAAAAARAALQRSGSEAAAGNEAVEEAKAGIASATKEVAGVGQEEAGEAPATVAALSEGQAEARPDAADAVDAIIARGHLVAVVEDDFAPFSFEEDGRRVGFDVDMMREFARRWLGDGEAVSFLPVTSDQRIATLEAGSADLIAAALTKTAAREELIDFSQTYFKDGQRLLVAEDSEIAGPCDLAGRKVAALAGTTSLDNLKAEAATCGFEADLVVFERQDQAAAALLSGEVDAFTGDGLALERLAKGQPLKVVGNHFSEEPYGFGIARGNDRLRQLVDLTLGRMAEDGTYAAIYQKWFGDELSPYPLQADASLAGDQQLMALATTDLPALFEPVAAKAPAGSEYVVQPGDTLSTIAGKVFGDIAPGAWRAIWQANKATIGDDPNRLKVGMRLTLPSSL
jgi:aspartate/glutamate/glutamine transport system substrate-binding protein